MDSCILAREVHFRGSRLGEGSSKSEVRLKQRAFGFEKSKRPKMQWEGAGGGGEGVTGDQFGYTCMKKGSQGRPPKMGETTGT